MTCRSVGVGKLTGCAYRFMAASKVLGEETVKGGGGGGGAASPGQAEGSRNQDKP